MSTEEQQNDNATHHLEPEAGADNVGSEAVAPDAAAADSLESVSQLQAEVTALREQVLLAHADMQNVRRRAERDVENAHKYALDKFVADLVSVVDNLERATAAIDPNVPEMAALGEGVQLTLKSFLDVLRRFNVEQVDPRGQPFDPDKHQAMTLVPNAELAPNTVIDVFQKGYLLNGRLVRPAMVVVSKGN